MADDLMARLLSRKPATATVTFAADTADTAELARLAKEVEYARAERKVLTGDDPAGLLALGRVTDAETALNTFRTSMVTVTFTLTGVGPTRVEAMIAAHPPSDEQIATDAAAGRRRPQYDQDTFAPALLAATITGVAYSDDPDGAIGGMTLEQTTALWASSMPVEDREVLFFTALSLDQQGTMVGDLGKG